MLKNITTSAVSPASTNHVKYRLGFFGDTKVGKTSILTKYVYDRFENTPSPTIGIDHLSKTLFLKNQMVRLNICDTVGNEKFRPLMPYYMKESDVAVVVYDVTNRRSFLNTAMWVDLIRTQHGSDILIVLVGNKAEDPSCNRQVAFTEGEKQAQMDGLLFMKSSAKSGYNVENLFQMIITSLSNNKEKKCSNNAADGKSMNSEKGITTVSVNNTAPVIGSGSCFRRFTKTLLLHPFTTRRK
eukprot:181423-Ditylum_brightwellii.AAC.1